MSTRARDQQKKQRQKEFLERKKHQESLKVAAKKAKRDASKHDNKIDQLPSTED
ncbi:hypothetical protein [Pontibacter sp. HSC-36F09]|uniref:hypothetical protein n=1 Tax=Pontibacter sp. HSC-36F09 TaxID=2910966 RepID=UPI0020A19C04|nr:hypothetical protein [Pontibacter sp. HSC-36F09]MCP2044022.1 hypothetical protein [Pontibacter sp. HSC-36F09]